MNSLLHAPTVLYQDNHLLVLSKPACMPCVPDSSGDLSLLDWGRNYLKRTRGKPGNVFLGVVHRLDRPVSGVVCFAITSKAASRLSDQMRKKEIQKEYLAVSRLKPPGQGGKIENFLVKNRRNNRSRVASKQDAGARRAVTLWSHVAEVGGFHLLKLIPETGRPHQLRVHCANMGCVIVGDLKYGDTSPLDKASIALHALKLQIVHPVRRENMVFHATPPDIVPWNLFHEITTDCVLEKAHTNRL